MTNLWILRHANWRKYQSVVMPVYVFFLALTVRLLYLASVPQGALVESVDAQGYDLLARNLRAGHGFSLQDAPPPSASLELRYQPDGLRTPLYPLLVAGVYALTGERPTVVAAVQAAIDGLTALITGAIVGTLLGRRAGIAAAILYALTPVQWRYTGTLLPEVPLAFPVALSVWLLIRLLTGQMHETRQVVNPLKAIGAGSRDLATPSEPTNGGYRALIPIATVCGVTAGFAALTKPNISALALVLAGGALWSLRADRRTALAVAGAVILAAVTVMGPWIVRNWSVFGRPFLSNANLGFVARVAAPATLGLVEGHQVPPWSPDWEARYHEIATQAAARHGWSLEPAMPLSPPRSDQRERQIAHEAWKILLTHPWQALRAHLTGVARSWAPLEQTFWYTHLGGRGWEETGVAANTLRDAVEILFAGRLAEAFEFAFVEPWARLGPLARVLWYGWGVGHLFSLALMALGVWQLRQYPALCLALILTIAYATLAPGPIGYVRFRVPVMPLITVLEVAGLVLLLQKSTGFCQSLNRHHPMARCTKDT